MVDISMYRSPATEFEEKEILDKLKESNPEQWCLEIKRKRYLEYLQTEELWCMNNPGKGYPYTFEGK